MDIDAAAVYDIIFNEVAKRIGPQMAIAVRAGKGLDKEEPMTSLSELLASLCKFFGKETTKSLVLETLQDKLPQPSIDELVSSFISA